MKAGGQPPVSWPAFAPACVLPFRIRAIPLAATWINRKGRKERKGRMGRIAKNEEVVFAFFAPFAVQAPCCPADGPDDDAGSIPDACRPPCPVPPVSHPRAPQAGASLTNRQTNRNNPTAVRLCRCHSALRIPRSALNVVFSQQVIHNGVCPCVHVKNRQIRVKIGQKGDRFRSKPIKTERISSCPS